MKLLNVTMLLFIGMSKLNAYANSGIKQEQLVMFCSSAIAGITSAAYEAPTNTYELPIFSEDLDNQLVTFLHLASRISSDPNITTEDVKKTSAQAQEVYALIRNEKREVADHCEQAAVKIWGECTDKNTEKNFDTCIKEKGTSELGQSVQKELAQNLSALILKKTELGKAMAAIEEPVDIKEAVDAQPTGISTRNLVIVAALGWLMFFVILYFVIKHTRKNNQPKK